MKKNTPKGFTLIEVLLALAIVAIALTALIKSTATNITNTSRIKEKTISHWVAMEAVAMVQLGLLPTDHSQELTKITELFNQKWYWRLKTSDTPFYRVQKISIRVSKNQSGPFSDELIAFAPIRKDINE